MAPLIMSPSDIMSSSYWIISAVLGLSSILVLLLCMKKKKQYVKNDEMDVEAQERLRTSSNATGGDEGENNRRPSQHSMPNERMLPGVPKNGENGVVHETPPNTDQVATPGAVSTEETQQNPTSSPKRSRRLPALPPPGQKPVDLVQAASIAQNEKDIDATYEDLRDDNVASPSPEAEVVGSGDSTLYAKVPEGLKKQEEEDSDPYAQVGAAGDSNKQVPEDLKKQEEEDSDPYAQVGAVGDSNEQVPEDLKKQEEEDSDPYAQVGAAGDSNEQPSTSGTQEVSSRQTRDSLSEEDKTMDSPTAVTYASVDKMKKTMSVKRRNSSSSASYVPPVPDRNFEEAESENPSQSTTAALPPPTIVQETPSTSATQDNTTGQARTPVENEETGPAYDTVSVRESFAHQRLRRMVEDEQRNRYVNTSAPSTSNPPDVYSQINEENPEAVYESVSAPGSADGTVGVTGRNLQPNNEASAQEDEYSTIVTTRRTESNPPPPTPPPPTPPNGQIENSGYDFAS